jgi:hypothetical protein
MRSDEGIQLPLFDMDKYEDTLDETRIIFVPEIKSHIEYTSIPVIGNDIKYCITEIGGHTNYKWLVATVQGKPRQTIHTEMFKTITEAMGYVETLTGKTVKFRR